MVSFALLKTKVRTIQYTAQRRNNGDDDISCMHEMCVLHTRMGMEQQQYSHSQQVLSASMCACAPVSRSLFLCCEHTRHTCMYTIHERNTPPTPPLPSSGGVSESPTAKRYAHM